MCAVIQVYGPVSGCPGTHSGTNWQVSGPGHLSLPGVLHSKSQKTNRK